MKRVREKITAFIYYRALEHCVTPKISKHFAFFICVLMHIVKINECRFRDKEIRYLLAGWLYKQVI